MGKIQHIQQGILLAAVSEIPGNLQVAQGAGIYHQIFRIIQPGQLGKVG